MSSGRLNFTLDFLIVRPFQVLQQVCSSFSFSFQVLFNSPRSGIESHSSVRSQNSATPELINSRAREGYSLLSLWSSCSAPILM